MSGPVQVIAASFQLGTDFERRLVAEAGRFVEAELAAIDTCRGRR